ncbi:MAG: sugar transferase [Lachnospiraceae bacterium]|nr:sugar transferase [Lachnospiraceae bacterium]
MYQNNREKTENFLIFAVDTVCVIFSYILATYLWVVLYRGQLQYSKDTIFDNMGIILFSFLGTILFFNVNKEFFKRGAFAEFMHSFKMNLLFAAVVSVLIVIKGSFGTISRGVLVCTVLINIVFMCIGHIWLRYYFTKVYKKKNKNVKMFLVTTVDRANKMLGSMSKNSKWYDNVKGIAIIDDNMKGNSICNVPVVADFNDMLEYARTEVVDEVFINVPYHTGRSLKNVIMEFENMGVTVHLNIEVLENFEGFDKTVTMLGDIPVISFANTFFDYNKLIIKRVMDIIGSIIGLMITGIVIIFLAPPLLLESKGPLFFKQRRVGKNGRFFYMYKFRSMYKDAEDRKKELMDKNEMNGLMFKMTDDPRITKVGRFIRKTSIDELPQFWNVLKGEMSLVGTRPPTVDEFKKYESYHKRRLSIKPGITGMWQVSGRSSIEDFEDVVKLDLEYIDNWCLALDIKILVKTVGVIFAGSGAK